MHWAFFSSGDPDSRRRPHAGARALAALAFAVVSCAGCAGEAPSSRPGVVVTVPPLAFFVGRLAGDRVDLSVIIPPGAAPESYSPTMRQLREVSHARLLIEVGHPGFIWETAWLNRMTGDAARLRIVDGSAGCARSGGDPHVWLSPPCARIIARNVAAGLTALLPDATELVSRRLKALEGEISEIDRTARLRLAPYRGRAFLVFHPAWGRFANEYGLRQVAIERGHEVGSARRVVRVLDRARRESMHTVFVQPQYSRADAELVAEEIGGRVVELNPLASDWVAGMCALIEALTEELRR